MGDGEGRKERLSKRRVKRDEGTVEEGGTEENTKLCASVRRKGIPVAKGQRLRLYDGLRQRCSRGQTKGGRCVCVCVGEGGIMGAKTHIRKFMRGA